MAIPAGYSQGPSGMFFKTDGSGPYSVDADGNAWAAGGEVSMQLDTGGRSQVVAITGASAQSTAITGSTIVITPTVDCFARQGLNPTAVANGTDSFLLAGVSRRLSIVSGNKVALIAASASGSAYITPGV